MAAGSAEQEKQAGRLFAVSRADANPNFSNHAVLTGMGAGRRVGPEVSDLAQRFGDRWRIKEQLGRGGQGDVFRVEDELGEHADDCALKRIRNPKRHARFAAEIEAIRRLCHPNVVKLLDHSALHSDGAASQFLVMPLATGGNLEQRAGMFEGSIDSVVALGKQLAGGIAAAHRAQIIHRDIKPANVLFADDKNIPLLADFGICLLQDRERLTEVGEVVGPVAFMAPELEGGGHLEVTPLADVYSLGKLLYFAVTGGVVLPRERIHEPQYRRVFEGGERHRLLGNLVSQMLAVLPERRISMAEVLKQLESIEGWGRDARLASVSAEARASLARMTQAEIDSQTTATNNATARQTEQAQLESVKSSVRDWLRIEFETAASDMRESVIDVRAQFPKVENGTRLGAGRSFLSPILYAELHLRRATTRNLAHVLRCMLCVEERITVTITTGSPKPVSLPERDLDLVLVPQYIQRREDQRVGSEWSGFFNRKKPTQRKAPTVSRVYTGDRTMLAARFKLSQWPVAKQDLQATLKQAIESFLGFVESGASILGT